MLSVCLCHVLQNDLLLSSFPATVLCVFISDLTSHLHVEFKFQVSLCFHIPNVTPPHIPPTFWGKKYVSHPLLDVSKYITTTY